MDVLPIIDTDWCCSAVASEQIWQQIGVFDCEMPYVVPAWRAAYLAKVDNAGVDSTIIKNVRWIEVAMGKVSRLSSEECFGLLKHALDSACVFL